MPDTAPLLSGFSNPALDAQEVFRIVLDAWARPGILVEVDKLPEQPPGLDLASAALALTLCDQDTKVWLSKTAAPAADWLRFHCGCPIVEAAEDAAFAFGTALEGADLSQFNPGDAMSPELGATVILQVDSLSEGPELTLSGPGIKNRHSISPAGLTDGLIACRAAMKPSYPAGLDLVLTAGTQIVCLPRTTVIEGGT